MKNEKKEVAAAERERMENERKEKAAIRGREETFVDDLLSMTNVRTFERLYKDFAAQVREYDEDFPRDCHVMAKAETYRGMIERLKDLIFIERARLMECAFTTIKEFMAENDTPGAASIIAVLDDIKAREKIKVRELDDDTF